MGPFFGSKNLDRTDSKHCRNFVQDVNVAGEKGLEQFTELQYSSTNMHTIKAYEEVVDFIAAGTTPQNVIDFRPSEESQNRVSDLLFREKNSELTPGERSELDHYMQMEHLMRLAKARARDFLSNE